MLIPLYSVAQFNADFTASDTTGCNTLNQVTFTATFTGSPTNFIWSFGNGNGNIGSSSPSASYGAPGTYDVTLIVTNGAQSETIVKPDYIVVYKNPTAEFTTTTPRAGCQPLSVTFNDLSTPGDAGIKTWQWVFGDGAISDSSDVTHVYLTASTLPYPVSLQVTDSNGCQSVKDIPAYITVTPKPVAAWSGVPATSCSIPHTVNFTNASTGSGTLNYLWTFGDNDSSTITAPQHIYTAFGNYTVKLFVTDNNGCRDSLVRPSYVRIANVVAGFTTTDTTICPGTTLTFTNTSTGSSTYKWYLDNVMFSTATNTSRTFNTPGDYFVKIVSRSTGTCVDSFQLKIHVFDSVKADFGTSSHYICELPDTIQYTDSSVNAATYQWIFGNGQTSTSANPDIIYDTGLLYQNNLVMDTKFGVYTDKLIVTSPDGCKDSITRVNNVEVNLARVIISADSLKGCIPLGVDFDDNTVSSDPIVSWDWDFGDGTTDTVQNPHHIYTVDGDVIVTLTVTNDLGCKATGTIKIEPGSKPQALFTIARDTTCASNAMQFTDQSSDPSKVDEWTWTFGDQYTFADVCGPNSGAGGSTDQHPVYLYQDTGFMDIELIVGYNGCYDTLKREDTLYVRGPVANVATCFDCGSPYNITVDGSVTAGSSWVINLGDGTIETSPTLNINHTYAASGDYNVSLYAVNDTSGCSHQVSSVIMVRGILAALDIPDTIACVGEPVLMSGDLSVDEDPFANPAGQGTYYYNFGDGTAATNDLPSITHQYSAAGHYRVTLVVQAANGCSDTTSKDVYIYKPDAGFTTTGSRNGCLPFSSQLIDTTQSDTLLSTWFWDFGNGQFSSLQDPTTSYGSIGNYTVQLIVRDTLGCSDTASTPGFFTITNPEAKFVRIGNGKICAGKAVAFINQSTGTDLSYLWDFGDNTTDTVMSPTHTFTDGGLYSVKLIIVDLNGCTDTVTRVGYIEVQDTPDADFSIPQTFYSCYPTPVIQFVHSDTLPTGTTYLWNLGNGATSAIENPFYKYTFPDTFTVSLAVTTPFGCTDTVEKINYVIVTGPKAEFTISDTVCKNEPIVFDMDSATGIGSFQWDFGDGTPFVTGDPVSHAYSFAVGKIYPQLIITDPGNSCTIYIRDSIFVHDVEARFSISDSIGCTPHSTSFTENSINAISYSWNFGNGQTSASQAPSTTYNAAGTYPVMLAVTSNEGCKDTLIRNVLVNPGAVVNVTGTTTICEGAETQLFASGAIKYFWTPSTGLSNDTIPDPLVDIDQTTTYTLLATDANNCTFTGNFTVNVIEEPVFAISNDTTIIIGDSMRLTSVEGSGLIYVWTPSYALSCTVCASPIANPLITTDYSVTITDQAGCFNYNASVKITVKEAYTLDVPSAFTPDGDGVNDIIYVDGWGIKELLEFKVYNRWGQVIFSSNSLSQGWDGTFKGVPQNIETYVYTAKGLTYQNKVLEKQGYIHLIR